MSNNINISLQNQIKDYDNANLSVEEVIEENFKNYKEIVVIDELITDISDWNRCEYGFIKNENGEFTNEDINDGQVACIYKTFKQVLKVSFDYRVSSEQNYDFLNVYLNGERVIHISGNTDYANYTKTFDAPTTTEIKFEYIKDGIMSAGNDAGFIKNLTITKEDIRSCALRNEIKNFKQTKNDIKYKILPIKNIPNKSKYKIRFFKDINNNIKYKIKPFKNITNYIFERIAYDLKTPPIRIIFKNFEE